MGDWGYCVGLVDCLLSFEGFGWFADGLFLFWEGVAGVGLIFFILIFGLRFYRSILQLFWDFILNLMLFDFFLTFSHLVFLYMLTNRLFYFNLRIRLIRLMTFLLLLYCILKTFFCLFLWGIFDDWKLSNFAIWPISEDHYDEETDLFEIFHFF